MECSNKKRTPIAGGCRCPSGVEHHLADTRFARFLNAALRRTLVLTAAILLLLGTAQPAAAVYTVIPVFLNGDSIYTQTGDASLLSVASDAARAGSSADAALLPAECAAGSLSVGNAAPEQIRSVLSDAELVLVSVSPAELTELLNSLIVYESNTFPHLSGIQVWAERVLAPDGRYTGRVTCIEQGGKVVAALPSPNSTIASDDYSTSGKMLTLATTPDVTSAVPWLARRAEPTGLTVQSAFIEYLRTTSPDTVVGTAEADTPRLVVVSDVIDASLVLEKLSLDVPSPVNVNLSRPDIVADTLMYALSGQNRELICRVWRGEIPYALRFSGAQIETPQNVSTAAVVSQSLPPGRKTANTFDEGAVFVDTRDNTTLPPGTVITASVGRVYEPGTVLYVYGYEENGDIGPAIVAETPVNADGCISFPVAGDATYVINSRRLDSAGISLPSAAHPYTVGVLCIIACYIVWFTLFIAARRRSRRADKAGRGNPPSGSESDISSTQR